MNHCKGLLTPSITLHSYESGKQNLYLHKRVTFVPERQIMTVKIILPDNFTSEDNFIPVWSYSFLFHSFSPTPLLPPPIPQTCHLREHTEN